MARFRSSADGPTPGSSADGVAEADPHSVARSILLRALSFSPKSRSQLATLLAERAIPDEVAVEVLDRYEEVGLIDDPLFARLWVNSRHSSKGLSKSALARELRTKGIDPDIAEEALVEITQEVEIEAARALAVRRFRSMSRIPREKQLSQLTGLLSRKGYSSGIALSIAREVVDSDASISD
jgi:regulatory protein